MLRYEDLEPAPIPENETPREFLLRLTGHDFDSLQGCSWEYVWEFPPMQEWMTQVIARLGRPQPLLVKKRVHPSTS